MTNLKHIITLLIVVVTVSISGCTYETIESNLCTSLPNIDALTILGTECGKATGSIEVISSSETPVTFSIDGVAFQESNLFTNLVAQSYTITLKNDLGCTTSQSVTIENLNGINILVTSSPSGCNASNGTISVVASGGPEPYSYILNGSVTQGNSLFSGLSAGTYTVLAVDSDGCSVQKTTNVISGQSFSSIKSIISANCATSSCHGGSISPDLRNNQTIQNNATKIALLTANGSMPPLGELTTNQVREIACWVSDGAPIN